MTDSPASQAGGAAEIRTTMKAMRRQLSLDVAARNADRLAEHLVALPEVREARAIGAYRALHGEIDPDPALELVDATRYLPVVGPGFSMEFKAAPPGTALVANRYGIDEPPESATSIAAEELDVVLVPLVAFDSDCARIGMGAGYYDRLFAFRKRRQVPPFLVGIAHGLQQVSGIEQQPWDVRLDVVVTEDGLVAGNGMSTP